MIFPFIFPPKKKREGEKNNELAKPKIEGRRKGE